MKKKWFLNIILILLYGLAYNAVHAYTSATNSINYSIVKNTNDSDSIFIEKRKFENLKEVYNDDSFLYDQNAKNANWWTRFKEWLGHVLADLFNLSNREHAAEVTDIVLKITGVIIFLLVIYFIFKAIMNREGKWVFGKPSDSIKIPIKDIENNIHATDFKKLIESAELNNNYRLAIRYYYLWLLKALSNAKVIEYDVEKTNSDYKDEITKNEFKTQFTYTSYLYNYIWYGEFDINETQFLKAKNAFNNFLKVLEA